MMKVRVEEGYPGIEDIFDNSSNTQPSTGGHSHNHTAKHTITITNTITNINTNIITAEHRLTQSQTHNNKYIVFNTTKAHGPSIAMLLQQWIHVITFGFSLFQVDT